MPQIAQLGATWASQVFWLVLTFGIVFLVVGRGMVPKVQSTIDLRDASVAADLTAAEAARAEADAQEDRWRTQENAARDRAQRTIGEARAKAAAATEATLAKAGETSNAQIAAAEANIAAASTAAMAEIEGVATEAAQDIVQRLSGAKVTKTDAAKAVKAAMHG
ncbi:ATPase [Sphingomonas donggukensis]|uniref:ATP synthase subunit b n=1 Tax=Sphingomonas donggukensis TaxID=2949093 RepID=A0ABY4TUC2_9SPHN|nr:ATPase [Sphingomonas donggukensis]URW76004.1 ATPase [Sphingomonas donggukensis]